MCQNLKTDKNLSAVYHGRHSVPHPYRRLTQVCWSLTLVLASHSHSAHKFPFFFSLLLFPLLHNYRFHLSLSSSVRSFGARLSLSGRRSHAPYNSLPALLWLCKSLPFSPALLLVIAPLAFPSHFVTLYKVKRSMKTLLICKWAPVKDGDSPLSETPPLRICC